MYPHPYVVDQLAEQHHRQLIALSRAERLARRRTRGANRRSPEARGSRRSLLGNRPHPTTG